MFVEGITTVVERMVLIGCIVDRLSRSSVRGDR